MMAERKARASPRKSSEAGLVGKGCVIERLSPGGTCSVRGFRGVVRSARETRTMPIKEARTPRSLRRVNFSVWVQAPMRRGQMDDVEVRIVVEATVVYWRQAIAK